MRAGVGAVRCHGAEPRPLRQSPRSASLVEPRSQARNFWQEIERAIVGHHPRPDMNITVDGAPPLTLPVLTLGQHSAAVLHDTLGLSDAAIAALTASHVADTRPLPEG